MVDAAEVSIEWVGAEWHTGGPSLNKCQSGLSQTVGHARGRV